MYPDVVTVKDVVTLTGYTLTTVHNWCSRGSLKAFQKGLKFCIPKIFLVDFFCSLTFRSITRKSLWHIQTLNEFSRKMKRKRSLSGVIYKVRRKKCSRAAKVRCIFCGGKVKACCRCTESPCLGQNTGASYFGLKSTTRYNTVLTLRF